MIEMINAKIPAVSVSATPTSISFNSVPCASGCLAVLSTVLPALKPIPIPTPAMGAEVFLKKQEKGCPYEAQLQNLIDQVRRRYEAAGEKVYFIPMGGSGEVGVPGYYDCAVELAQQQSAMGLPACKLLVAVGSMGTYMGLFTGIFNEKLNLDLQGIAIAPFYKDPADHALEYYKNVAAYYGLSELPTRQDFAIRNDYTFGGYNNAVKEVREAIYYLARREGILLDPCYTGKAFYGLMDLVEKGSIAQGETVIFLHTGGQPGLNGPNHRLAMIGPTPSIAKSCSCSNLCIFCQSPLQNLAITFALASPMPLMPKP